MGKTERLQIRITPELKEKLQALADFENRTISNYIENLIIRELGEKKPMSMAAYSRIATKEQKGDNNMKKNRNETSMYMEEHKWTYYSDGGTAGIYTNGTLYVMCNGAVWFASKTPDASERWAKGWKNMLPAMKFADSKTK